MVRIMNSVKCIKSLKVRNVCPWFTYNSEKCGQLDILHLLAYSSCHPPLQMPSFSTLSLRDRDEHQMPVYFTQAAFSIQAPITQRDKNPWFQTINGLKFSQLHSGDI